jgi:hypothetical protein
MSISRSFTQSNELPIASRGHRLAGFALDVVLAGCTFFIGWLIWALILWGQGQTPAKQILKMRVFGSRTQRPASWGHMAVRDLLIPLTLGIVGTFLGLGISSLFWGAYTGDNIFNPTYYGYLPPSILLSYYLFSYSPFLIDTLFIFGGTTNSRLRDRWAKTIVLNISHSHTSGAGYYGQTSGSPVAQNPQYSQNFGQAPGTAAFGQGGEPFNVNASQASPNPTLQSNTAADGSWTGNEADKPWWFNNPDVQNVPQPNGEQAGQKFCASCGNANVATARFCTGCGKPF